MKLYTHVLLKLTFSIMILFVIICCPQWHKGACHTTCYWSCNRKWWQIWCKLRCSIDSWNVLDWSHVNQEITVSHSLWLNLSFGTVQFPRTCCSLSECLLLNTTLMPCISQMAFLSSSGLDTCLIYRGTCFHSGSHRRQCVCVCVYLLRIWPSRKVK
jgi:hypothetical protein